MDTNTKERYREALYRNQIQLEKYLSDPQRDTDDVFYYIAGILRVLLCDGDSSLLLYYAKENNIELEIWGPNPPSFKYDNSKNRFSIISNVASYFEVDFSYKMKIEEYLKTEIGLVPLKESSVLGYTAIDIIKWTCNKEGITHMETKPFQKLESIKSAIRVRGDVSGYENTDSFLLRSPITQLGMWALTTIKEVLSKT